ncbi:MAG TPA: hypothetical protein VFI31_29735 [Pirellulales bacterium]|nr:hypothetical protein [Pirellulales bacterium]
MKELLVNFSQLEDGFELSNEDMRAYFDTPAIFFKSPTVSE